MTKSWVMVLLDYFRDADLQFPGLHDKDLYDMLPTPIGEKQLNSKQSFKVNSNLNLKIAVLSLLHLGCSMEAKRNYAREKERRLLRPLRPQEPKKRPISQLNTLDCITSQLMQNPWIPSLQRCKGRVGKAGRTWPTTTQRLQFYMSLLLASTTRRAVRWGQVDSLL